MAGNAAFNKALFSGLFLLVFACRPSSPTPEKLVMALQQMQELGTSEYHITKVVRANDNQTWYKIGDRKILISCEARVKAGIHFSELDTRYISQKSKTISIRLPEPSIISVNLPPERIRVAYQDIGFFRDHFSISEQNALMRQAEAQVIAQSRELGILEDARNNARSWLTGYLSSLGFENIDIQFGIPITIKKD